MIDAVFNAWFGVVGYENCVTLMSLVLIIELWYTLVIEPFDIM
jgi:hypothetical protein